MKCGVCGLKHKPPSLWPGDGLTYCVISLASEMRELRKEVDRLRREKDAADTLRMERNERGLPEW